MKQLETDQCCAGAGLDFKIPRMLCNVTPGTVDRAIEETRAESSLLALKIEPLKPGGVDMTTVGRLFAMLRMIGLKTPPR